MHVPLHCSCPMLVAHVRTVLAIVVCKQLRTYVPQGDHATQELVEHNIEGEAAREHGSESYCRLRWKQLTTIFHRGHTDHYLDEYGEALLNVSLKLNRDPQTNAALLRARAILNTIPRRQEALIKGF